jgi:GNAT superfamily N-acetyltransferase
MSEVIYRPMGSGDVPVVRALVERTIRTSYREVYSSVAIEFFVHYHSEEDITTDALDGAALVAVVNGEVVGTAALRGAELRRVFVEPSFQGQGIGTAMTAALLHRAWVEGIVQVRLDASLVSRVMYERMGFVAVANRSHDLGGGDSLPYCEMILDL